METRPNARCRCQRRRDPHQRPDTTPAPISHTRDRGAGLAFMAKSKSITSGSLRQQIVVEVFFVSARPNAASGSHAKSRISRLASARTRSNM